MTDDWRSINLANWESRVPVHTAPDGYDLGAFDDPGYLTSIVRYDLPRLGRLDGLDVVHLQCHIGTDTVSLSRLGARSVTGVDFSPAALRAGRALAGRAGAAVVLVESDVDDAVDALGAACADLVYTGIGALCWLPDIKRWASVVASLLRPGGRLFIREGHPMLWSLDERADPAWPRYQYFETAEPLEWVETGTYVDTDKTISNSTTHSWNHSLGEIITALLENGMTLTAFTEHDSVPWNAIPGQMTLDEETGEWRMTRDPRRLAASHTIQAQKR
jgi:SAM-dependent methyltransferase